ncbi:ABC transporter substrate binding protein [Desulfovibrio sp. TomC]|uniref:ABC transporter substrate binding protein n=1 Tax=Desulfovibrio sp. TomC TaxID=1562888 RepID=UPI00057362F2|nr:ABC transporter substrate binding protein [Desulfovibrio sp. TomC]KHK00416.1 diguanylate cyclase/phosphodiesterase (GGDEF & EAL domains) with PAS/PAC sensor(s) [Desulfovibrio sp. TomC]
MLPLLGLGFVSSCFAVGIPEYRIIFINSYHRGYSWSDGVEEGFRERLGSVGENTDICYEYLDSRRFAYGNQLDPLAQAMKIKYANYRPDLLVVSDNAAFDFAIKYRETLFPGIPIVFCGYNYFTPDVLQGIGNITGVNEEISFQDTVAMALTVHPDTRTLVFVLSTGDVSSARISHVAETSVLPQLAERFSVVVLKDASLEDIRQRLAKLPRQTLVFLGGQTRDQAVDRALTSVESGRLIAGVSPFPVYTFWDFHLDTGVIGGHILTGQDQGRAAAKLALQVLGGTKADALPVVMTAPATDIFDYTVLQKFDVSPAALPPGSVVINKPFSAWDAYRWQIVVVVALLAAQALLVMQLLRVMAQRKKALVDLSKERALLEDRVAERTTELRKSEELFRRLFENASDAIFLGDMHGRFLDVNREAQRQTGYSREELLRMGPADLDVNHTPQSVVDFHRNMDADRPIVFETVNRRKDGELIHLEVRGIRLFAEETGAVLMGIARDITQRKRLEEELRDIAFHDSLTRLPNRRLLLDRLQQALPAGRIGHGYLAVLFVDLNNFKQLNDTHGHAVGDRLLVEVARRLLQTVRVSDMVARLGGDEFVVLLEGLGDDAAQAGQRAGLVAAKIQQALAVPYVLGDIRHTGSASIGIKLCQEEDHDPDAILKEADAAMYTAKRKGADAGV